MLSTLLSIALLHWLVLITPGANVLLVSQLAASSHRRSALYASLGISFVAVIWALLAILGVNALFAAHPSVRLALQIAGALYLSYVAVRLWRSGASSTESPAVHLQAWAAFRLGFITNLLNPKSGLFFSSKKWGQTPFSVPSAVCPSASSGRSVTNAAGQTGLSNPAICDQS